MPDQGKSLRIVLDNGMTVETNSIDIVDFEECVQEWSEGHTRNARFSVHLRANRQNIRVRALRTGNYVSIRLAKVAYAEQFEE